jgi:hypothetical protein
MLTTSGAALLLCAPAVIRAIAVVLLLSELPRVITRQIPSHNVSDSMSWDGNC